MAEQVNSHELTGGKFLELMQGVVQLVIMLSHG